ncbi:hypothetical protein HAX54_012929 [Datura stramonium]|uniref:Uncharacterized protein n=1 Tax=Datura stramonium TaxID=4076 RepID=A0ABS8TKI1_DATST|nr:hypothetical protein [Datura stramonium]
MVNLPDHVRMDIEDENSGAIRIVKVKIQYDYLPKYYWECKLQGHIIAKYRYMYLEVAKNIEINRMDNAKGIDIKKLEIREHGSPQPHLDPSGASGDELILTVIGVRSREEDRDY